MKYFVSFIKIDRQNIGFPSIRCSTIYCINKESGSVIQKLLVVKTEDLNLIAFLYWALLYLVTFLNLAFTYHHISLQENNMQ